MMLGFYLPQVCIVLTYVITVHHFPVSPRGSAPRTLRHVVDLTFFLQSRVRVRIHSWCLHIFFLLGFTTPHLPLDGYPLYVFLPPPSALAHLF